MDEYDMSVLVDPLISWFLEYGRSLPWRAKLPGRGRQTEGTDGPNPYYVWLSEIMLQQTRVEAVKPYFRRFIERLPDVVELAACPEDELLKLWEGLGYYNRVRNLQKAARQIMEEYGGEIPSDYEALLRLKGIGHYTAGAIASIAFGQPVAAVDGNVLRVINRVTADDSDIAKQSVRNHMESRLSALLERVSQRERSPHPYTQPGIFNQALMDLGALVCVPNGEPHCRECPWENHCLAKSQGRTAELPVRTKAARRRVEERTVLVVRRGNQVALHKRPPEGLLAGLYELPNREGFQQEAAVIRSMESLHLGVKRIRALPDAKHIFSHVEWKMKGYEVVLEDLPGEQACEPEREEFFFVEAAKLRDQYAIPAAFAAYMREIGESL